MAKQVLGGVELLSSWTVSPVGQSESTAQRWLQTMVPDVQGVPSCSQAAVTGRLKLGVHIPTSTPFRYWRTSFNLVTLYEQTSKETSLHKF